MAKKTTTNIAQLQAASDPNATPAKFAGPLSKFARQVLMQLQTGANAVWVHIHGDEGRVQRELERVAWELGRRGDATGACAFHHWNPSRGASWQPTFAEDGKTPRRPITDPHSMLRSVATELQERSLIMSHDLAAYLYLQNEAGLRLRRELIELCKWNALSSAGAAYSRNLVVLSYTPAPHPDLRDYLPTVEFPLPDFATLRALAFTEVQAALCANGYEKEAECSEHLANQITNGLLGLTVEEGNKVLATAAFTARGFNQRTIEEVANEKSRSMRGVEGLQFTPRKKLLSPDQLAGWDTYFQYLLQRKVAYADEDNHLRLDKPRGVVLLGQPGTGKNKAAEATARILGTDLVTLDVAAMFDRYVGGSEQRIRHALDRVTAMGRVTLFIDELEKALGDAHKTQGNDGGVSSRMLSTLLQWLAARDMLESQQCFVIVAMNRGRGIPPELVRAGRFDKRFAVMLPDAATRRDILRIHLAKRGIDPDSYGPNGSSLYTVANELNKFAGAELEEVVIEARSMATYRAVREHLPADKLHDAEATVEVMKTLGHADIRPTVDDMLVASRNIKPAAELNEEDAREIDELCKTWATPVGAPAPQPAARKSRKLDLPTDESADFN